MTNNTLPPSNQWDYDDTDGELSFETEGGYTARLVPDQFAGNPRVEWDELGTLFLVPNRSLAGDKGAEDPRDLDPKEIAVLLPVYVYDHSIVRVSTHSWIGRAQHAEWDSGCAGAIYMTREDVRKEYGWKVITKGRKAKLESYLAGAIVTLNDWLAGDIVGLIVTDPDGEELENVWGFYPDHDEIFVATGIQLRVKADRWATVIAEAQSIIDHHVKKTTINPSFQGVGI